MAINKTKNLLQRIELNPQKLGGKPVIKGTRIAVEQILKMLAAGVPTEEILVNFPHLKREDIFAAVQYATNLVEEFHVYPRRYFSNIKQPA